MTVNNQEYSGYYLAQLDGPKEQYGFCTEKIKRQSPLLLTMLRPYIVVRCHL